KSSDEDNEVAARKRNRRIKAAIKLYEQNDNDIQEFDKDELLPILAQNGYHSIEQSDSDDELHQKLPDNK
ncbi:5769_t:CDS:2, partial [Funneliformis caledonium]